MAAGAPELPADMAGIDLRVNMAAAGACGIREPRSGAIDRRSLTCAGLKNGRRSALPLVRAGSGETRRMVLGRSRREILEYRLGKPTVEAGEGGKG